MNRRHRLAIGAFVLGLFVAGIEAGQPSPQALQEHVATLKASLAASQAALRQYEWIETTVVSLKGETKSHVENRAYYGADGVLQKVPITAPAPQSTGRGLKGRIAANKKEELTEYMKEAVALVKEYVPPDAQRIQAAKDGGRVAFQPLAGSGKPIRLTFTSYLKANDSLAVDLDAAVNRVLKVAVSSYLSKPQDKVALTVAFGSLTDGTSFANDIVLDAPAQNLRVNVHNSGYRKLAR